MMVRIVAIIFVSFIISMTNLGSPVIGQVAFEEDEAETISPGAVDKEELADLKDHPLDLNTVSFDQLLKLPVIDSRLARAVILYRQQKGFTEVEELKNVPGMSDEIFEGIAPYIKVKPIRVPVALQGDFRWRMKMAKPDSEAYLNADPKFQNPPYVYNRTRLKYGNHYEAGWVLRHGGAQSNSGSEPAISFHNLWKYYLTKYWLVMRDVYSFDKIVIGNYKLQYNQGLIFYYPLATELVRPIKIKAKGVAEDRGTAPNVCFRGLAVNKRIKQFDLDFFYSNKKLDASLNPDGTVKQSLIAIRANMGYITSDKELERNDKLTEELIGGRIAYNFLRDSQIGFMGYQSKYSPSINPSEEKGYYLFRGERNRVFGFDFNTWYKKLNLYAEYAKCIGYGEAWLVQPMLKLSNFTLWAIIYKYDPDYYNEHSSATTIVGRKDEDWNENGVFLGGKYEDREREVQIYFRPVGHPWREDNLMPTKDKEFWFNIKQRLSRKVELYFRQWNHWYDKKIENRDLYQSWKKTRVQVTWNPDGKVRLRVRWDGRKNSIYELKQVDRGHLIFGDLKYNATRKLKLEGRLIFFEGEPGVAMSEIEFLWPMGLTPFHWWTYGKGVRYYLMVTQEITKNTRLWIKYENTRYYNDYGISRPENKEELDKIIRSRRHVFRLQWDVKW
ncbi:MAG: hypothetical protein GH154_01740 [Firmicutes bacterium]|nr:hypothetical protein [Bacillota bacterium]